MKTQLFGKLGLLLACSSAIPSIYATNALSSAEVEHSMIVQQRGRLVKGVVLDITGETIIGANVYEKGNPSNGCITDLDGNFSLNVADNAVLIVSYIGYVEQEVKVGNQSDLKITLKEDSETLDEVVVVGYGTVKKSNLTSSVSKITDSALKERPFSTASEAFQGQLAGVQAQASNGGIPGEEMTIRIRGINTINGDSSPLYVIDGVPRDNMSDINPSDISTIQILKDASATAIYGSRGANGVVLIETKTGKGSAKPTVTFNAYYGVQTPEKHLDLENGYEYIAFNMYKRNVDYKRQGGSMSDPQSARPQSMRIPEWWSTFDNFTDWQSLVLRTAPIQSYEASASGASDMGTVFFSVGYMDQDGIVKETNYNRLNARLNASLNITKNIQVGMNASVSRSVQKAAGTNLGDRQGKDSSVHHALMMSPLVAPGVSVNSNGGIPSSDEYGAAWLDPLEQLYNTKDDTETTRAQISIWGEWKMLPGLSYKIQYSNNYDGEQYEYFQPGELTDSKIAEGSSYSSHTNDWVIQNTLTYDNTFKGHHLNVLLGQSAEKQTYYIGNMEATGWPYDQLTTLNLASTAKLASTERTAYTNASFFGRLSYDYKEKYLMTVSVRRDGSSRFGQNAKWGTFPSLSLGWKLNEENFLKSAEWINLLKLRASLGTSGNDRIGDYQYMALLGSYNSAYGNALQSGAAPQNLSNEDLQWEQTRSVDIGFDFSAFNNRIQFNFDYYINTTNHLLFDVPVPYSTGFDSQLVNLGKIRNQGWEVDLTTNNLSGAFKWTSNLNLSHNSNKVLDMGTIQQFTITQNGQQFITKVGGPISQFYGYKTDGILTAEDIANGVPIMEGQEEGNDKIVDINGDGKITTADMTTIGNNLPDLTWGFTNRFSYKNFELSVLLQGQFGGDILNLGARHNDDGVWCAQRRIYSRWVHCYVPEEYKDCLPTEYMAAHGIDWSWDGDTPSAIGNNPGESDARVYSATYMRIKNITLSYTFPKNILSKIHLGSLKIYGSIDNVYTFTNYPGFTPETSSYGNGTTMLGVDYSTYPLSRRFTLGVNVSF